VRAASLCAAPVSDKTLYVFMRKNHWREQGEWLWLCQLSGISSFARDLAASASPYAGSDLYYPNLTPINVQNDEVGNLCFAAAVGTGSAPGPVMP
jgi:hypothetical protein